MGNKNSIEYEDVILEYAFHSIIGRRPTMEDSELIKLEPNYSVFAIFDGHLGNRASKFCSQNMLTELKSNPNFLTDPKLALTQAFLGTDIKFLNYATEANIRDGTTAILALILGGKKLLVANAGDSRGVAWLNDNLLELSFDHKPFNPDELDRIQKAGGFVQNGRIQGSLGVSRGLGDLPFKDPLTLGERLVSANPDITEVDIDPDNLKFIVLACDGLFDVMSNQSVVKFVKRRIDENMKLQHICEELVNWAYSQVLIISHQNFHYLIQIGKYG